jgi:tight adherence protein B
MRSALRAVVAGAALCVPFAGVLAGGDVAAQDAKPDDSVRVEQIDARGDPWVIRGTASEDPSVQVGGKPVDAEVQRGGVATDVVVVLDNDRALGNGTVQLQKAAAASLAPGTNGISRVAVVSTAREGAAQESGWTDSPQVCEDALAGVRQTGDAATWDALARASNLLDSSDAPSRRVVAILSADDRLSNASAGEVERQMRLNGSRLDVIVLPQGADTESLSTLVSQLGGSLRSVAADEDLDSAAQALASQLDGQFEAQIPAPTGTAPELVVSAGEAAQEIEGNPGDLQIGSAELLPASPSPSPVERIVSNPLVRWAALALLIAAVGGAAWALLSLVVPDRDSLQRRLSVYDEADEVPEADGQAQSVATVPILQRAVAITSDVAERRGILEGIEVSLERANLPLRAAEAMFFVGIAALLAGVLATVLTGNILVGLVVVVLCILLPKAALDTKVRLRQKKFVSQLPDMLSLLAGTLKAGYSITQGFEAVSQEIDDPMGRELRRVVTEHRLGRTLEDALDMTAARMGSDDFEWTVMAIKIQREVGGNLAELLLTVANTMTERERLRREVATLTAEGKISAIILGFLPPGLAAVMFVMNPGYIKELFTPGLGYLLVGLSSIAMVVGFLWMKKIITIEA